MLLHKHWVVAGGQSTRKNWSLPYHSRLHDWCWLGGVLSLALAKSNAMGVILSFDCSLEAALKKHSGTGGKVRRVRDRLVLQPSNCVVEASDYLSHNYDGLMADEETTAPLERVVRTLVRRCLPAACGVLNTLEMPIGDADSFLEACGGLLENIVCLLLLHAP